LLLRSSPAHSLSLSLRVLSMCQPTPVIHTRYGRSNGHPALWGPQLRQSERLVCLPSHHACLIAQSVRPSVSLHVSCPVSTSCGTNIIAPNMADLGFLFWVILPYTDDIWLRQYVVYFGFLCPIHWFGVYYDWNRLKCRPKWLYSQLLAGEKSWWLYDYWLRFVGL
jgi:hypothetical protein